jgi:hypothetical protein
MQQARAAERLLQAFLSRESLPVFASVAVAPEVTAAVQIALQTAGLGAMRPNAVMAVWPQEWRRLQAAALDKHVLKVPLCLSSASAEHPLRSCYCVRCSIKRYWPRRKRCYL